MAGTSQMQEARPGPRVTVVVASVESGATLGACVASVVASLEALGEPSGQILVLDASRDGGADLIRRDFPHVRVETFPPGTLVPALWARGIALADAPYVALTTGHCVVSPTWAGALLRALGDEAAGAGGPLVLRPGTGPVDWAVYLLRYSAFLPDRTPRRGERGPGPEPPVRPTREIPADNALYRAEDLRRHADTFRGGFWEVPFHRELRAEGRGLVWVPESEVGFGPSWPLGTIVAHRYAHGRDFGRWRVVEAGQSRLRVTAAAPLVPLVLALRTLRRVGRRPGLVVRFVVALPFFLVLAAGWALGEAVGAAGR